MSEVRQFGGVAEVIDARWQERGRSPRADEKLVF